MKMKLFGRENSKRGLEVLKLDLEKEVNEWLELHSNIKVMEIKQSSNGGSLHASKLFISIWYEETTS